MEVWMTKNTFIFWSLGEKIGQNIEKPLKTQNPHHFKHIKGLWNFMNFHEFLIVGTLQRMEGHPKQNLNYYVQAMV